MSLGTRRSPVGRAHSRVSRAIALGGAVAGGAYVSRCVLSWLLAPVATYEARPVAQRAFFANVANALSFIRSGAMGEASGWRRLIFDALNGRGPFVDRATFAATFAVPTMIATLAALAVLWTLWKQREHLGPDDALRLRRWSIAFALLLIPAAPVLVPDFWLSVAWGRTLAAGVNPYYQVPVASLANLPIDAPLMHMTYGPLWAYVSGAVMACAGGSVFIGALLFKVLLATCWIGTLLLATSIMRDRPPFEQCLSQVMIGWLPIGVESVVAEGHNDVVMVLLLTAWVTAALYGHRRWAVAALAGSILFKYATAPLLVVDLVYRGSRDAVSRKRLARAGLVRLGIASAIFVVAFLPVMRDLAFFSSTKDVHLGHFFLPSDAILAFGDLFGVRLRWLALAVEAVFPLLAGLAAYRLIRDGGPHRLLQAAGAVMLAMALAGAGHLWPWYVLWFLVPLAFVPTTSLARLAFGIALVMPYPLIVWTVAPHASDFARFHLPSLAAYLVALVWLLVTAPGARRVFGETRV